MQADLYDIARLYNLINGEIDKTVEKLNIKIETLEQEICKLNTKLGLLEEKLQEDDLR